MQGCLGCRSCSTITTYMSVRLAPLGFCTTTWGGRRGEGSGLKPHFPGFRLTSRAGGCKEDGDAVSMGAGVKSPLVVVSFYKFANLPNYVEMRKPLRELCEANRVSGGIILAPEGINGSICGTREAIDRVFGELQSDIRLADLRHNEAPATAEEELFHHGQTEKSPLGPGVDAPFRWDHVRIKLKNEVVPLGIPGVNPSEKVGKYVKPKEWNRLISDPDTILIDVRNSYETRIGKFRGALDPETVSFREFPAWADSIFREAGSQEQTSPAAAQFQEGAELGKGQDHGKSPRIAMYCTGGIRCEKATSFLLERGFNEVYHLEGGILKYLEETPTSESLWEGECFVFDKRVSVVHDLKQGTYSLCYACKKPVNEEDVKSSEWEEGVSCPHCISLKSDEEKDRARARQRQYEMWGVIGGPGKGQLVCSSKRKKSPTKRRH